jgi:hypothetical protein
LPSSLAASYADEPHGSSKLYRQLWDAPCCTPLSLSYSSSLDAALRAQASGALRQRAPHSTSGVRGKALRPSASPPSQRTTRHPSPSSWRPRAPTSAGDPTGGTASRQHHERRRGRHQERRRVRRRSGRSCPPPCWLCACRGPRAAQTPTPTPTSRLLVACFLWLNQLEYAAVNRPADVAHFTAAAA